MESFKRLNKNSKLEFVTIGELTQFENEKTMILQIVPIGQYIFHNEAKAGLTENIYLCEIISRLEDAMETPSSKPDTDIEFENSLDTVLNKDPFGGQYSGEPLRTIFEKGDRAWVDKALRLMHNQFIVDKLNYIMSRGGYGNIKN